MAGKAISQLIKLEGADEIRRLLEQIGQAGTKAFEQIKVATSDATKNLELISRATAHTEQAFAKMGEATRTFGTALGGVGGPLNNLVGGLTRIGAAFGVLLPTSAAAAGVAVAAFAVKAVKAGDNLGETASALGLTADAYQKLQFAAVKAGVSQEQFSTGIARFSKQVQDAAGEEAKSLLQFAETVGKSLQESGVHVVGFGRKFDQEFRVIGEAAQNLQQRLKSQGIEVPLFRIRSELAKLANGTAEQRQQFERLTGQSLPAINEGLERLRTASETGGNALRRLGIQTRDAAGNVRPVEDILGDVAERFKGLPEGAQRTALALELFGRAGAKMGSFLSQGRAGIQDTIKELERLGILLSKEEVEAADKAADAFDLLGLTAQNLKTKLGLVFEGPVREGATALTRILTQNQTALQTFARKIESSVTPIIRDLVRLISGQDEQIENKWILTAREAIIQFGLAVQGAVLNIIIPAFRGLMSILNTVASAINSVFGTNLTGGQIGIALVVAQVIGAFGVLAASIRVVIALVRAFAFTPLGAIITALGLIILNWDTIKQKIGEADAAIRKYNEQSGAQGAALFKQHTEAVKADVDALRAHLANLLTQGIPGAWEWIKTTASNVWEFLRSGFQTVVGGIESMFNSMVASIRSSFQALLGIIDGIIARIKAALALAKALAIGNPDKTGANVGTGNDFNPGGFAGGGLIRGRGTSTSDSIIARLSRGEFVQRAAAVQYYGPQFMAALNALRIPKDLFKGFNAGGLVDGLNRSLSSLAIPRFAAGGMALAPAGGRLRNIGTIDLRTNAGNFQVLGDDAVAESLSRALTRRAMHSAGRKPNSFS